VLGTGNHGNAQFGWLELAMNNVSSRSESIWNMQQYVGEAFRSRAIVGH